MEKQMSRTYRRKNCHNDYNKEFTKHDQAYDYSLYHPSFDNQDNVYYKKYYRNNHWEDFSGDGSVYRRLKDKEDLNHERRWLHGESGINGRKLHRKFYKGAERKYRNHARMELIKFCNIVDYEPIINIKPDNIEWHYW